MVVNRKKTIAALAFLATLALALAINLAYATPTAVTGGVSTTGSAATSPVKTSFFLGEPVFIHWYCYPDDGTVNITITNSAGNWIADVGHTEMSQSESPQQWVPETPGDYRVLLNGQFSIAIGVASVFVVPESALGTVMATVVGFGAFGVVSIVKRNRARDTRGTRCP